MKTRLYPLLALALLAGGCIEDKGNYNYSALNTIEITGIATDTTFRVDQFDTLRLAPVLKFKNETITNLSHEWKINHEVVSTEPALEISISLEANSSNTYYAASLIVTDNATDLKYYKDFRVVVTTSFVSGLFVLSERADETATLSFQRRDRPNALFMHDLFEGANPLFGALGKKPRQIVQQFYPNQLLGVLCSEGERKLSLISPTTLELARGISNETIRGGYTGDFTPAAMNLYLGGMITGGGKMFGYNYMGNESVYKPIAADTIEFADWVDTNSSIDSYAWIAYDNKGERFLKLEQNSDPLLYDKITPLTVENGLSTAGQKFIAGGVYQDDVRALTYDPAGKKAYSYGIPVWYDLDLSNFEMIIHATVTRFSEVANLVNEQSVCLYDTEYWFIANGNVVKRLHEKGNTPVDWFTAPKGNVTTMTVKSGSSAAGADRLFIATYDGAKSYIHEINLATREQLNAPLELDGKVVFLLAKGTWTL
ncbi:MAG: hypothetical protein LBD64_00620 [Odoribacteraceae bacterium]|nr:hypothetical protein [Odoribacteraceae bacterium]